MMEQINSVEDEIQRLNSEINRLKMDTKLDREEKEIRIKSFVN